ncbi:MAG: NTP transferase domain-containing protein [Novosphingobium sp.]|uniref:phosphocholine cytidylyltransferase family protein n=1 Tax=Novosphingobium sp. TaxID=1874826 RepID=UPI0032B73C9C
MDALIIAAGFGSRLRDVSDSKPLTLVAGISLLELGVRQARAAGVSRVVVATGHAAERLEAAFPAIGARCGVEIVAARVEDWSKPNGWSVLAGAARIDGEFLLMMSDHIFGAGILDRLAQQGGADRGVTLAIDRRIDSPLVDPDDATWVETGERGFIRAIGKTIARYDAVDCGAFLATPELADAIRAAIADGKAGSLSEGMQRLADADRAATMEIDGAWWLDVDDPRAHALAEAQAPQYLPQFYG